LATRSLDQKQLPCWRYRYSPGFSPLCCRFHIPIWKARRRRRAWCLATGRSFFVNRLRHGIYSPRYPSYFH